MLDIYWFAGFFDGEGSIWKSYTGRHYQTIRMSICQSGDIGKLVLQLIQKSYGGNFRTRNPIGLQKLPYHELTWNGRKACELAKLLQPFCLVKDRAIKKVLEQ